jgi:hypothetical protein
MHDFRHVHNRLHACAYAHCTHHPYTCAHCTHAFRTRAHCTCAKCPKNTFPHTHNSTFVHMPYAHVHICTRALSHTCTNHWGKYDHVHTFTFAQPHNRTTAAITQPRNHTPQPHNHNHTTTTSGRIGYDFAGETGRHFARSRVGLRHR